MRWRESEDEDAPWRSRRVKVFAGAVALMSTLVLVGLFFLWGRASMEDAGSQLENVVEQASSTAALVADGDVAGAAAQVKLASETSGSLVERMDSLGWRVLTSVPLLGDRASALVSLATSLDGVIKSTVAVTPDASGLIDGTIRAADGTIDMAGIQRIGPALSRLSLAMHSADTTLSSIDPAYLTGQQQEQLKVVRDVIGSDADSVGEAAKTALRVATLLGSQEPRHWVVLVQNPAQASGSGGLVAGYVLATVDKGRLTVQDTGVLADLKPTQIPALIVSEERRALWQERVRFWQSFDGSSDFPSIARLAAIGMAARDTPADGIVTIGPAALSGMLAATGPVTAGGVTVTADNVVNVITRQLPKTVPDPVARDRIIVELTRRIIEAFWAQPLDLRELTTALGPAVADGALKVWSGTEAEQSWLATTAISGALSAEPGSNVAVSVNNIGQTMTDPYVDVAVDYRQGACLTEAQRRSVVTVELANHLPMDATGPVFIRPGGPPKLQGSVVESVYLYGPPDAQLKGAELNGKPLELFTGAEAERPVWWAMLTLRRGEASSLAVTFDEPFVKGSAPTVTMQPMAKEPTVTVGAGQPCSAP